MVTQLAVKWQSEDYHKPTPGGGTGQQPGPYVGAPRATSCGWWSERGPVPSGLPSAPWGAGAAKGAQET